MTTLRSQGTPSVRVQAATDAFWFVGGYSAALVAATTAVAFTVTVLRAVLG